MTKDIEREAFEATQNTKVLFERIEYIESNDVYLPKNGFENSLIVSSLAERLNFGWSMWKAATTRAEEKLEGCVVVPVEMPDSFNDATTDYFNDISEGENYDAFVKLVDIDNKSIWAMAVEAARGGNE